MAFPVEELRATTGRVNWKAQAPTAPSGLNKTDPSFLKVHLQFNTAKCQQNMKVWPKCDNLTEITFLFRVTIDTYVILELQICTGMTNLIQRQEIYDPQMSFTDRVRDGLTKKKLLFFWILS